jgi:selenoprotein W-related protein
MKVTIEFCRVCNYLPIASALGIELKKNYGAEVVYKDGKNGIYNVIVDGELIFSKFDKGRFPKKGEILEILQNRKQSEG